MPEPITPFASTALTAPTSAISLPGKAAARGDFDALIASGSAVAPAAAAAALALDPDPLTDPSPGSADSPPDAAPPPSPDFARPVPRQPHAATGKTLPPAPPPPRGRPLRAEDTTPRFEDAEAASDLPPGSSVTSAVAPPTGDSAAPMAATGNGKVAVATGRSSGLAPALAPLRPDDGAVEPLDAADPAAREPERPDPKDAAGAQKAPTPPIVIALPAMPAGQTVEAAAPIAAAPVAATTRVPTPPITSGPAPVALHAAAPPIPDGRIAEAAVAVVPATPVPPTMRGTAPAVAARDMDDASSPPIPPTAATTAPEAGATDGSRVAAVQSPAVPVPPTAVRALSAIDPAATPPAAVAPVATPPAALRRQLRVAPLPDAPRTQRPITPDTPLPQATDRLLRARPNTAFAEPISAPEPTTLAMTATAAPGAAPTEPSSALTQPVDTQTRDWRTQMLDRIERFAAAEPAPGRETRITLSPDALGEVAVRLRETDRGIEVVLDAAPEARALLAEAAPRLTELAESRGLRMTLQQGGTGEGSGERPQPQPRQPNDTTLPNRRAAQRGAADTPTDERIA